MRKAPQLFRKTSSRAEGSLGKIHYDCGGRIFGKIHYGLGWVAERIDLTVQLLLAVAKLLGQPTYFTL